MLLKTYLYHAGFKEPFNCCSLLPQVPRKNQDYSKRYRNLTSLNPLKWDSIVRDHNLSRGNHKLIKMRIFIFTF